ncbi:MAG TPA: redoxin domain-containing protein [archaeon]|nr:redoxin domain-containing protein [archaeon]
MGKKKIKIGDKAPTFKLDSFNSGIIDLAELIGKQKIFLIFSRYFGCPGSQFDLKKLLNRYPEIEEEGGKILFITQSGEKIANEFIEREKIEFPVIPSSKDELYKEYGLEMASDETWAELQKNKKEIAKLGIKHLEYEGWEEQEPGQFLIDTDGSIAYKKKGWLDINSYIETLMFSVAIKAHKDYIENEIESPTEIIAAQIQLGFLYQALGILTGKIGTLEQARESFLVVVKESNKKGFHFHSAAAYEYLANVENRLGNYMISSKYYEEARETYKKSLQNIELNTLKEKITDKIEYLYAWNLIEKAKSYHIKEEYLQAKEYYTEACVILRNLPNYNYEASYYYAWSFLEEAENLSKEEKYDKAIKNYENTKDLFKNSIMAIRSFRKNKKYSNREVIKKLEEVAKSRMNYCSARIKLEEARVLGKQGEHSAAAEKFATATTQFREVCIVFKKNRKHKELKILYYLCRAWENIELAKTHDDPDRFAKAAQLFTKVKKIFSENKMKLLASGNSAFCQALKLSTIFDKEINTKNKTELYSKIQSMLRIAASSYRKGGFEGGADWTLATSTYFDATWYLIRADKEMSLEKKNDFLKRGSEIFKSTAELFGEAGYRNKEKEIIEKLNMVKKGEKIIISALNTIQEPSLFRSALGIVTPLCPIEISQPTRISEVLQFKKKAIRVKRKRRFKASGEKIRKSLKRVKSKFKKNIQYKEEIKPLKPRKAKKSTEKTLLEAEISEEQRLIMKKMESEIDFQERKFTCIVHKGVIHSAVYICPNCNTFYCLKCVSALKKIGENCWYCNFEFDI